LLCLLYLSNPTNHTILHHLNTTTAQYGQQAPVSAKSFTCAWALVWSAASLKQRCACSTQNIQHPSETLNHVHNTPLRNMGKSTVRLIHSDQLFTCAWALVWSAALLARTVPKTQHALTGFNILKHFEHITAQQDQKSFFPHLCLGLGLVSSLAGAVLRLLHSTVTTRLIHSDQLFTCAWALVWLAASLARCCACSFQQSIPF
jgi:hypothetical protein